MAARPPWANSTALHAPRPTYKRGALCKPPPPGCCTPLQPNASGFFQFLAPFATQTVVSELSRLLLPEDSEPIPVELVRAQQKCEMYAPPSAAAASVVVFSCVADQISGFCGPLCASCARPAANNRPTLAVHAGDSMSRALPPPALRCALWTRPHSCCPAPP